VVGHTDLTYPVLGHLHLTETTADNVVSRVDTGLLMKTKIMTIGIGILEEG